MRSGLRFSTMVESSESTLKSLGYQYFRHGSEKLVEFEVTGPGAFVVRIQELEDIVHPNPVILAPSDPGGARTTHVSITLGENRDESRRLASTFVSGLLATLPSKPWKGLGFVQSMTAKSLWKGWAAGSEDD